MHIPADMLIAELEGFLTIQDWASCARVNCEWNSVAKLYETDVIIRNIHSMYPNMDVRGYYIKNGVLDLKLLQKHSRNYMIILRCCKKTQFMSFSHIFNYTFKDREFDIVGYVGLRPDSIITESVYNLVIKSNKVKLFHRNGFHASYICTPAFYALFASTFDAKRLTDATYGSAELTQIAETPTICIKDKMTSEWYDKYQNEAVCKVQRKDHLEYLMNSAQSILTFIKSLNSYAQPVTKLVWSAWKAVANDFIAKASQYTLDNSELPLMLEYLRLTVNKTPMSSHLKASLYQSLKWRTLPW
jgi:hypothetical protein